jgi:hypothetical protein
MRAFPTLICRHNITCVLGYFCAHTVVIGRSRAPWHHWIQNSNPLPASGPIEFPNFTLLIKLHQCTSLSTLSWIRMSSIMDKCSALILFVLMTGFPAALNLKFLKKNCKMMKDEKKDKHFLWIPKKTCRLELNLCLQCRTLHLCFQKLSLALQCHCN